MTDNVITLPKLVHETDAYLIASQDQTGVTITLLCADSYVCMAVNVKKCKEDPAHQKAVIREATARLCALVGRAVHREEKQR